MADLLLVESSALVARLLTVALEERRGVRVRGTAPGMKEARERLCELEDVIVLIAPSLGDEETVELLECIQHEFEGVKGVLLGVDDAPGVLLPFIEAGAAGYVTDDAELDELFAVLGEAKEDKARLGPEVAASLMERVADLSLMLSELGIDAQAFDRLTPREKEVLERVASGLSNREIAEELTIEVGTVKNHVHNILGKLEVQDRKQASRYFWLVEALYRDGVECD